METKGDDLILTHIFFGGEMGVAATSETVVFFSQGGGVKFEEANYLGIALIFSVGCEM